MFIAICKYISYSRYYKYAYACVSVYRVYMCVYIVYISTYYIPINANAMYNAELSLSSLHIVISELRGVGYTGGYGGLNTTECH